MKSMTTKPNLKKVPKNSLKHSQKDKSSQEPSTTLQTSVQQQIGRDQRRRPGFFAAADWLRRCDPGELMTEAEQVYHDQEESHGQPGEKQLKQGVKAKYTRYSVPHQENSAYLMDFWSLKSIDLIEWNYI